MAFTSNNINSEDRLIRIEYSLNNFLENLQMAKINIIAEGDSWFALPHIPGNATDVLVPFVDMYDTHPYRLVGKGITHRQSGESEEQYRHGYFGHTIAEMEEHIETFDRIFDKKKKSGKPVKAMIFSGGGNDLIQEFIKDDSELLLNHKKSITSKNALNKEELKTIMTSIKNDYKEFIKLCKKKKSLLITHSYFPPDPTRGGYSALFGTISEGPWFKKAFDSKGYPQDKNGLKLRIGICEYLIKNHFINLLKELKKGHPNTFDYVNLTGLNIQDKDRTDEIHFSYSGCKKVAELFIEKLNKKL